MLFETQHHPVALSPYGEVQWKNKEWSLFLIAA